MKLFYFVAILAVLATTVLAWEKEDHEIFDLVSDVEASEGKGTTFYSWLDVPSTATTAEIAKAYRKMSMRLHPDKNPNVKAVHDRFARLGVVSTILRNKESRKRYDFFYKNGVPKWRGTGYYYQRFRPGLGSVVGFLVIFTSGLQLLIQRMNYKTDIERVERFMKEARTVAWGPKMIPIEGKRKVKVNLGGRQRVDDDGNVVSGRWIDMVVEGQNVYILDPSGDLDPLDTSTVTVPSFSTTWFPSLIRSLYKKIVGSAKDSDMTEDMPESELDDGDESSTTASDQPGSGTSTPREDIKAGRQAAVKAGGKRRKGIKKR